jgi:hypothetical protein
MRVITEARMCERDTIGTDQGFSMMRVIAIAERRLFSILQDGPH